MNAQLFRAPQEADTLVVSYYPLVGNHENTGPRYQREAELTGFNVLGIIRDGTNTTDFDSHLRSALSPEHFDEYCADQAKEIQPQITDYDRVIFRGQSTGSFPTLGIVKTGNVRATHLLVEDGINLRTNRHGGNRGPLAARWDWLKSTLDERHAPENTFYEEMPKVEVPDDRPLAQKLLEIAPAIGKGTLGFAAETYHWAPLWHSSYSSKAVKELGLKRPDLPILMKFIGHSGTATEAQVVAFQEIVEGIQDHRYLRPNNTRIVAQFDENAWHNYLTFPGYGARNLRQVSRMLSLVV